MFEHTKASLTTLGVEGDVAGKYIYIKHIYMCETEIPLATRLMLVNLLRFDNARRCPPWIWRQFLQSWEQGIRRGVTGGEVPHIDWAVPSGTF